MSNKGSFYLWQFLLICFYQSLVIQLIKKNWKYIYLFILGNWDIFRTQFWIVVLEKTSKAPWTARRSHLPIFSEINSEYSLEGLMLKLKLLYFDPLMWKAEFTGKYPDVGKDWGQKEKGAIEDEMVRQHQGLNGHDFEQTPGDSRGQGSLPCCSSWGHKESNTT